MGKRLFWYLPAALLALLLVGGGEPAAYGASAALGTPSAAQPSATPAQAGRDEPEGDEQADEWEDEEWDEWPDLVLFGPEEATPSSALPPEAGCSTAEELCGLLEEGEGDIRLSGEIELEPGQDFYVRAERAVQVDMNGYGILVPAGAKLEIQGPVLFEGHDDSRALFQVGGELRLREGVEIRGEGREIVGIAVSDPADERTALQMDGAAVWVSGRGSIGIDWRDDRWCGIEFVCVKARGQESVGVRAYGDVSLKMCKVSADGAAVSAGGEVRCDMAEVSPVPAEARVITRKAMGGARLEENGISIAANSGLSELWEELQPEVYYVFYDVEGAEESISFAMPVSWENVPRDISSPGTFTAVCRPEAAPDWLAAELPDIQVPIRVVDPEKPHIQEIFRMEETVAFRFFREITGADRITLLCSGDDGATWQEAASMPGCQATVSPALAVVDGLEMGRCYLFALSVTGGPMEGLSPAVPFSYFANDADRAGQGNRDGDDRGDQGEMLPDNGGLFPWLDGEENEAPDEGGHSRPGGGGTQVPDGDGAQEPDGGGAQSPGSGGTQEPGSGGVQEPDGGGAQEPDSGGAQSPGSGGVQEPDGGGAQLTDHDSALPAISGGAQSSTGDGSQAVAGGDRPAGGQLSAGDPACPSGANVVLSKDMLDDQLKANPQSVTLLGDGIRAVIPSDSLGRMELAAGQRFCARLERLDGNRFEVRFWAGQHEVRAFEDSGFSIDLEYEPRDKGAAVVCRGEDGSAVSADCREGRARVSLERTGIYALETEAGGGTGQAGGISHGRERAAVVTALTVLVIMLY